MWDERYAGAEFAYGTEPNDFLAATAARYLPAGGEVLSLAEGEGRNGVFLARRGFRVTGVDGSSVGLAKARELAAKHGVTIETIVSDLAVFDLGVARWDGIVSIWCHTPSAVRESLHRRVVASLRPGGVLILESYTPDQLRHGTGGPSSADMLLSLETARRELAGLDFVVGEEKVREIHEGPFHGGASAVVQIVARKP